MESKKYCPFSVSEAYRAMCAEDCALRTENGDCAFLLMSKNACSLTCDTMLMNDRLKEIETGLYDISRGLGR